MRLQNLNETGTIRSVDREKALFHFEYTNGFYGACSFVARVRTQFERLDLDDDSLLLESEEVKRGSVTVLLTLARSFFHRQLARVPHLEELEEDLADLDPPDLDPSRNRP